MKTLADFKRRLIPGTELIVTFPETIIRGNLSNTVTPGKTLKRIVKQARSGDVIFLTPEGKESYLSWPKAKDVSFPDANTVAIKVNDKIALTYVFV